MSLICPVPRPPPPPPTLPHPQNKPTASDVIYSSSTLATYTEAIGLNRVYFQGKWIRQG